MKPKISVIIPVYNGEKTLRACLESVCAQEYPEYEVIVVNNNSTDATQEIIEAFADQRPQNVDTRALTIETHGAESAAQSDASTAISSSHRATEEKEAKTVTVTVRRPVSVSVYGKALDACTQDGPEERDGPLPRRSVTCEAGFGHAGVQRKCILKTIFEPYRSRGAARNAGIKAASGEIIAMTDADCVVPHNWLSTITHPIRIMHELIVVGSEKGMCDSLWSKNIQKMNERFVASNKNGDHITHLDTKNCAFSRSIFDVHQFDARIKNIEDFDLFLALKEIAQVYYLEDCCVAHHHKRSFNAFIGLITNRGYWTARIYNKHRAKKIDHAMFDSFKVRSLVLLPIWVLSQYLKRPLGEAFFLTVQETFWRVGMVFGLLAR